MYVKLWQSKLKTPGGPPPPPPISKMLPSERGGGGIRMDSILVEGTAAHLLNTPHRRTYIQHHIFPPFKNLIDQRGTTLLNLKDFSYELHIQ
jgi:hypothetical protein